MCGRSRRHRLPPSVQDAQREVQAQLTEVSVEEILEKQRLELEKRQLQEKARNKLLLERGYQPETLLDELQG